MGKTKKLIELDDKAIKILEQQAKLQKRSLKNYIEFTLEDTASRFSEPSDAYKAMMDEMIKKYEDGQLEPETWEAIKARYGK
jgi:hypothetical protein